MTDNQPATNADVWAVVETCESYAEEEFDGEAYHTNITLWQDGDFRVEVKHGKEHERSPYRQDVEYVTYRHEDGGIYYADKTRFIDQHREQINTSRRLEQYREVANDD